jgi:hypothetical protein
VGANLSRQFWIKASERTPCEICQNYQSGRTATQDHSTILGQYSQAAEAAVLTKMFQGTSHSRSFWHLQGNANRTSGCTCTRRLCTAQTYEHTHTHTRVGCQELAREWRVEIVLRRATSRPRWCRLPRRNMLSSCSRDRYVC